MKDISKLTARYFDIPTQEIADHIKKWLATLNFELKHGDWNIEDRRLFFPSDGNVYFFTHTEDDRSWRELYNYGMPKYESPIKNITEKLTEDNIRDFYFEVNNQDEADDVLDILEDAGEIIIQRSLSFISDSWCYISYFNGLGWRLTTDKIGNYSTYNEFVNLYRKSKPKSIVQLHRNITINGKLPDDKVIYINDIVDECINSFQVGESFLDLVNKKESKITSHNYTYYPENDKLYVNVSNDRGDKTQCIYNRGKWASKVDNLIEEAKKRYPIGTKFRPAHIGNTSGNYCLVSTENFKIENNVIYAKLKNNKVSESFPFEYGDNYLNRVIYYHGKWAEILENETIKPNSATSPKKITELKYPDVVHIQSEQEYGKLHKVHSNMNKWNSKYNYYLIGQGYSEKRKSYEVGDYTIYEMDQIIMDEQPKTSDMQIFPGIKVGDIVVSLIEISSRKVGDMFEVLPKSKKGILYYLDFNSSSNFKTFRLATYEESEEYEKGVRNINNSNTPAIETILEKANRMYPIGTKVKLLAGTDGEEVEAIIKEKFILYDNGSVSYRSLPGYVYSSRTNEWAKIIVESKHTVKADVESTSKSTMYDFKVDDYVKIVTIRDERLAYKKILGKVFQVTEVYNTGILNRYVKGYKESYPDLFNNDNGVFMTDIILATQDEINEYNLEKAKRLYPPGTIVKWKNISNTEIVPSNPKYKIYSDGEIGIPYMTSYLFNRKWAKIVGVSYISEDLNDVNLKCKISNKTIDTKIVSIPTINKELKQKNKKFYF